ncbi:hypothetical protein [Novosphingobium sp.]|uniref:hypothetical protein n=1 Tax=Novosphingobium sp. TaxID=1874826 RepID=UPI0025E10E9D|nr:hypothetical protein [Novosphingobium sp.]
MKLFGSSARTTQLTCDEIVGQFAELLEKFPAGNAALPFEAEIIKAAIVARAAESDDPVLLGYAREGFISLVQFTGKHKHVPLADLSEASAIALVDRECATLRDEFEKRLALKQEYLDA